MEEEKGSKENIKEPAKAEDKKEEAEKDKDTIDSKELNDNAAINSKNNTSNTSKSTQDNKKTTSSTAPTTKKDTTKPVISGADNKTIKYGFKIDLKKALLQRMM